MQECGITIRRGSPAECRSYPSHIVGLFVPSRKPHVSFVTLRKLDKGARIMSTEPTLTDVPSSSLPSPDGSAGTYPSMDMQKVAVDMLQASADAVQQSVLLASDIVRAANWIGEAVESGHKVLACGNGGSACDAQHFVAELMGHFEVAARAPLPAIALSADVAVLTAIGNDYSFADIFARQVRSLATSGDVIVGISTSGESENVLRAFLGAPAGVRKIALTGQCGQLGTLADLAICVPASRTAPIQAAHISIIHAICAVVDRRFTALPGV